MSYFLIKLFINRENLCLKNVFNVVVVVEEFLILFEN